MYSFWNKAVTMQKVEQVKCCEHFPDALYFKLSSPSSPAVSRIGESGLVLGPNVWHLRDKMLHFKFETIV